MLVIFVVGIACLVVATTANIARAKVIGECVNCHTMHNSQNDTPVDSQGPNPALLNGYNATSVCVGCHTSGEDTTIVDGYEDTILSPLVDAAAPAIFAAGTLVTTDQIGSNGTDIVNNMVHDLGIDIEQGAPGYNATQSHSARSGYLTCAGIAGCHGNESTDELTSIKGSHHEGTPPTGVGYRMLLDVNGTGPRASFTDQTPDRSWNYTGGNFTHVYEDGISRLCGNCHGDFHMDTGTSSPFTRHPTDDNAVVNNVNTDPILGVPTGGMTDSTADGPYAICQSCHYSHGGIDDDVLRFDYDTQIAGSNATNGCLNCHEDQR
jgi:predicted CXXCH cytochrome family protein